MHILIVTTYFEPDSGAAAVRLSRLARILQERGHTISVLTTMPHYPVGRIAEGYQRRIAHVENRHGMRVIRTWLLATPSPRISRKLISQNTFMLTATLRGFGLKRPDVVLIEAQPIFTSLAGAFISRVKRAPYVLNVSDLWPDHLLSVGALRETHPVYRLARSVVNATYRRAAGIVAMSPAWAEAITGYIGATEKIRVIYNGVDLARFHPDVPTDDFRARYGLSGNTRWVTFIGTFATQYDFDTMLAAARRFADRPDVCFAVIGSGSQGEGLRQRLAADGHGNVRVIDWIDHDEMPAAWCASDVAFWAMRDQPLYRGTIPAKLYEALACGVPVAAATEGVAAGMIAESGAGHTVPCGDVDGLAGSIERLLDPEERARCSASARAFAIARFDPERVADAYEEALLAAQRR